MIVYRVPAGSSWLRLTVQISSVSLTFGQVLRHKSSVHMILLSYTLFDQDLHPDLANTYNLIWPTASLVSNRC
jgi:hypothetical protein